MITEMTTLEVDPNRAAEFIGAFAQVRAVLARADGYLDCQLLHNIEQPGRFVFEIHWDTVQDHTERFLGSALFENEFEPIVRPFLQQPPDVRHFTVAA